MRYDLADAAHPVGVEVGADGLTRFGPALQLRQRVVVQEVVIGVHVVQEAHDARVRADDVGDVQEIESHLRRDVAGGQTG